METIGKVRVAVALKAGWLQTSGLLNSGLQGSINIGFRI